MEELRNQTIQTVRAELSQAGKLPVFIEASTLSSRGSPSELLIMKFEITEDEKRAVRQFVRFLKKI